jgi:hypothetical protein
MTCRLAQNLVTTQKNKTKRGQIVAKSRAFIAPSQVDFGRVSKKLVVGRFDGGDISGNGGLLLLSKLEKKVGIVERFAASLIDRRSKNLIDYSLSNLCLQRVLLIAAGYEDTNDVAHLKSDPMFKLSCGQSPTGEKGLASQPTLSRFENSMSSKSLYRAAVSLVDSYIASKKKPPARIYLDFDGSYIEAHGNQQLTLLRGFYNARMYFPLFVFDQDGELLTALLRPGNYGDVTLALPVLKRLVKRLRAAWPEVEIVFRGDGAFHSARLFDWCEDNDVYYITAHPSNHALKVGAAPVVRRAARKFDEKHGEQRFSCINSKEKRLIEDLRIQSLPKAKRYAELAQQVQRRVRVYGQFNHKGGSKQSRERRFVCYADVSDMGLERKFVVTNLPESPKTLMELYSQRGRAELFIKEMKSLKCTRMSCREFFANQFRLLIFGLAYSLLRRLASILPKLSVHTTMKTIRESWLKIPVQVKETDRNIWLRWTSAFKRQKEFFRTCETL